MLVLPMIANEIVVNVSINFKNMKVEKDQLDASKKGYSSSDIIIGKHNLRSLEEYDRFELDPLAVTDFIRKSINYTQELLPGVVISTKKYQDSDFYDVYKIPFPPFRANKASDYIYGLLVNSIRLSYPNEIRKDRLSFIKAKLDKIYDSDVLNRISSLKDNDISIVSFETKIKEAGFLEQIEALSFLNSLDYKIEKNDVIPTSQLNDFIMFFSDNKKENRALINYKKQALTNYNCYKALASFNAIIYNQSLSWPVLSIEQEKILRKRNT